MSDQYTPPPRPAAVSDAAAYRASLRPEAPQPVVVRDGGGGFSAGMLVAAVFVVVAILAYAVFNNRDMFNFSSAPAPAVQVNTGDTVAPAAAPMDPAVAAPTAVDPTPVAPAPADAAPTAVDPAPVAPAPADPAPAPDAAPVAPKP